MELVWQSAGTAQSRKRTSHDKSHAAKHPLMDRCYHVESAPRPEAPALEPQSETTTRESSLSPGRTGPYNPESVLEDLVKAPVSVLAPTAEQREPCSLNTQPARGEVQPQSIEQSASAAEAERMKRQLIWYKRHRKRPAPPPLSEHQRKYLEYAGAFDELPRSTTDALLPIYVSLLDDLIPVVDGARIFRDHSNGNSSTYLVRAMCLVICKAKQAAPFLRLTDDGPILEPLEFASKLLAGLDAAIRADLESDRVTKVQILALMHLHNDGVAGVDRSLAHLSQAICEAWSISLHHKIAGNPDQEQCDLLWWSLRNLDRLNKPITSGAAPFMIDDMDVSLDRIQPREASYRSQLMGFALILGDLMVKATKVYKASSKATVDDCDKFPSLAELVSGTSFHTFYKPHKAYLEIWYHVTAMLSCKYSGPRSVPYNRRLASTDCVLAIISLGAVESLPPLPLMPYAISMCTTVIYRAIRDAQRDTEAACRDLRLCCDALDSLSHRWTSVKGVARLARQLWMVTKSGNINGQPNNGVEPRQREPSIEPGTSAQRQVDGSLALAVDNQAQKNESVSIDDAIIPMPMIQHNPIFAGEEIPELGVSCFQIDRAFNDLFDYGVLNGVRDPETWEFFHVTNDGFGGGFE